MSEQKVKAISNFEGAEAGELSFKAGDVLTLLEKDDSGNAAPTSFFLVHQCWQIE
jgi:hypothetical protein